MNCIEWGAAPTYMMNWYRAFGIGADDMLGHTWSLAIEEQFYLLWPAFLILVFRRMQLPITLVLIRAVAAHDPPLVYTGRISYEICLWHYPIVVLAVRHLPTALM